MKKDLRINDSFIANALRNCGYNNYSAIADIIDNSLEPEVESSFVKVDFETSGRGADGTKIQAILIIDDGCGMSMDILEEAMSLGSETKKRGDRNLGRYGAGMKTASFSIGQKMEVFTMKKYDSKLSYAKISLEDTISRGDKIQVSYLTFEFADEQYCWFRKIVGSDHGTIVKISSLDRLTNRNYNNFKGSLKHKLAETFNKYITANVVQFYVCKDEVPYVDLMGNSIQNDLMGEGVFDIDRHQIRYKAWYMPRIGDIESFTDESHIKSVNGTEYTNRTINNQGLYIYRQNRLVGKALTLGMWTKHPYKNGFRCEIFIDGTCDYLFGSTFTKMIGEQAKGFLSQSLYDKMYVEIMPYVLEAGKRDEKDTQKRKEADPAEKKVIEEFYKRVTDKQNSNMMLKANRKGENNLKERDENEKEHTTRGKQKNPNPIKNRINKWLDGFEERPMGRTDEMYGMERTKGKRIILINTDHPFYQKFYSKLNTDLKFTMAQIISCQEIAKQNVNYYGSPDVQAIVDNYNVYQSSEVSKSLSF